MAKGLGFVTPQRTSPVDPKAPYTGPIIDPVNPEGNPNVRKGVRGPASWEKYTPRRSVYQWMAGNNSSHPAYGSSRYGSRGFDGVKRRDRKSNDSGSLPEAYLNFIER